MKLNPHQNIRRAVYWLNVLGTPIVTYLLAKELIGTLEVALWGAEMTAVFTLAGLNTPKTDK